MKAFPIFFLFGITSFATLQLTTSTYTSTTLSVTSAVPSTSAPVYRTTWTTGTPYPCPYGFCNGTCCKADSVEAFFDCANGQKVSKSLVCNRVNNCKDGSDESICSPWPSKITVLPKPKVEVYCGDHDQRNAGTLTLECESAGHPTPSIRWKKYEGHVPSKCQQYSKRGYGVLTCPNFQQSDQGAYSCVAENSVKSAESQPKSIAKCNNTINCKGFRVVNDEHIEYCLECYCSGKTTQCQNIKSIPTISEIRFPDVQTEIFMKEDGEIVFIPTKTNLTPSAEVRNAAQEITYCSLSEIDFKETSFLKSFGRSVIIPRYKGKADFLTKAPDLIIQGNNLTLVYTASLLSSPEQSSTAVSVRFWPGNWHHLNKKAATREDLMKILSNVDSLLIRCEYQQGQTWNGNATILVESSLVKDYTTSVSYLEKCNCPSGYDGLSCETCAAGYTKKPQGNTFVCEKIYVPPPVCKEGYLGDNCRSCDTSKGYQKRGDVCEKSSCHPDGSVSIIPNSFGSCSCKEGVTGDSCDKCKNDSFYLHKTRGCLKCWCSGITNQCTSSSLRRTIISNTPRGGYNSSDGRNFWLLPSDFKGNRLTSYGGYLNYTMKYQQNIRKENSYLTVELLSKDDVTLIYTHPDVDKSSLKNEKSWSVLLTEANWKESDRTSVSRGVFLTVLSKIKAIYIESPYHLSSGKSNLTTVSMSSASSEGDDENDLALEVEQCSCPKGYTGLSCESCSEGYYKRRNGTVTQCIKCNCSYCDPDFGCPDCPQLTYRDNPEEEKMPLCKPCPCNGNGVSCIKDDYNQIFCRCKSGFTGMHCENAIPRENDFLTFTISPRKINFRKIGTTVSFNCSFSSSEEMMLAAKKIFSMENSSETSDSIILNTQGSKISRNFEVVLEARLKAVECCVYDPHGRVAGLVVAAVENLITVIKPVKITNCYSDTIEVKELESKDVICEVTGSPAPRVTWYKTRNGLPATEVDTTEGVHTIESATLKDNGTIFTCVAENSEGKATCTRVLIVREKCEVIDIYPKHIREVEGNDIVIQCKTTANSSVLWAKYYNEEVFALSPGARVENGSLRITKATVLDSGTYICSAEGERGKINKTVSVVVEEKRVPPTADILEYDKTLKVGESFEVDCITTGKPTPVVTWTKTNDSLKSNVIASGNKLKINKAVLENSGVYKCTARSKYGSASGYIIVEVENAFLPPNVSISVENITPNEGDVATVKCLSIGYPRPQLSWHSAEVNFTIIKREKDNMILMEPQESVTEEIRFTVPKGVDQLVVTCLAENKKGKKVVSTTIKVLQAKNEINETVEFVPIGSYFELRCEFSGELSWKKLYSKLLGDECKRPNNLMIPSVQIQHNGTYVCESEFGSEKIINLIVTGFVPRFSRASYSYLILPTQLKSLDEIRIEISFSPTNENGVLLEKENRELNIYLENSQIHVGFFQKSGQYVDIAISQTLQLKTWYSMVVSIIGNQVDVTIYDNKSSIYGRKTQHAADFKITQGLEGNNFFVGSPSPKWSQHMGFPFWRRFSHFDGCISRLSIDRHEFDIVKESSYSKRVTLCRRCLENPNLCLEKGKCFDAPTQYGFICVCPKKFDGESCPASCVGKGCETQFHLCGLLRPCGGFPHKCINKVDKLECTCAPDYTGTTCEQAQKYSFCTTGNGYVKLSSNLLKRHLGESEVIRISFTLSKPNGQLLWQGDRANHLSIAVRDKKVHYVYLNQHSKLEINGVQTLELNEKYVLSFERVNRTVAMELNSPDVPTPEVQQNSTSKFHTNRVKGDIYLGNVPNNIRHHFPQRSGFNGCILYVSFGEKGKVNLPENSLESVNISFNPKPIIENYIDSAENESNNEIDYNEN